MLELLLQDEIHPRAIGYQLAAIQRHVSELHDQGHNPRRSQEERLAIEMLTEVRLVEVADMSAMAAGETGRGHLASLLATLRQQLLMLSDVITATYFRHEEQMYQLIPARQDDNQ